MSKTLFKKNPFFCPAPFQTLTQDFFSHGGPCCYQISAFDHRRVPITDRWKHEATFETLRRQHLNGEKPALCTRCYREEDSGIKSLRQWESADDYLTEEDILSGAYKAGPKKMTLKLSNICNFACRTCGAKNSSLFKAEGDFYARHYGDTASEYVQKKPADQFSEDEMKEIAELCRDTVEFIEFYGGEPMLNTSHYVLLQDLIRSGKAGNVTLYYATNGSRALKPELKELWRHFKKVRLLFSLDGFDENFHYIRWPGNWAEVKENILRVNEEMSQPSFKNIQTAVNTTVSILNLFYLPELDENLRGLFPARVLSLTVAHEPNYYSIINLPDAAKETAEKKLRSSSRAAYFEPVLHFMNSRTGSPDAWKEFVLWTEKKDKFRNLSLEQHLPELYKVISSEYRNAMGSFKAVPR